MGLLKLHECGGLFFSELGAELSCRGCLTGPIGVLFRGLREEMQSLLRLLLQQINFRDESIDNDQRLDEKDERSSAGLRPPRENGALWYRATRGCTIQRASALFHFCILPFRNDGGDIHVDRRPARTLAVIQEGKLAQGEDPRERKDDGIDVIFCGGLCPLRGIQGETCQRALLIEGLRPERDIPAVGEIRILISQSPHKITAEIEASAVFEDS